MNPEQRRAAEAAIRQTLERWAQAVREADVETLGRLVTEDSEFWTQQSPPLEGREQVVETFKHFFERFRMRQEFERRELIVSSEWALLRGTEINTLVPTGGGSEVVQRQRAFSVLRRSDNGEWLFARGMTHLPPETTDGPENR